MFTSVIGSLPSIPSFTSSFAYPISIAYNYCTVVVDYKIVIIIIINIVLYSGTEAETKEFMAVCVETLKQYPQDDLRTPVFIYERLCSIIYPEENDVGEFFLTLEKDPQQEDFLQVR